MARSFNLMRLREALTRTLCSRSGVTGEISLRAVPSMVDEYVRMCDTIFAAVGREFSSDELARLKTVLENELALAFAASQRSHIVISYNTTDGQGVQYHVRPQWRMVEGDYENWLNTRTPPLFGTEPDARVMALAGESADPTTQRVLDLGAGTGRNALPLARRGHPVDAVELTPTFADTLRADAERESLDVRVIVRDIFATTDDLRTDYQLIVVAEVVPDFRSTQQLRGMFELAASCLAPGGRLVFNTFVAHQGYRPDSAARELGQQMHTCIFTHEEVAASAADLPLELVADDSAYDYEKEHLPDGAWPPTGWFETWATGRDLFPIEREKCPIELRWLVYQKTG